MNKFLTIILAIFEFLFYTVLMVLVGSLVIHNEVLKLVLHFVSLSVIAILLYFLIRFILLCWLIRKSMFNPGEIVQQFRTLLLF